MSNGVNTAFPVLESGVLRNGVRWDYSVCWVLIQDLLHPVLLIGHALSDFFYILSKLLAISSGLGNSPFNSLGTDLLNE